MKSVIRLHRSHMPVDHPRHARIHIPVGAIALLFVLASLVVVPRAHAVNRHVVPEPNASAAAPIADVHFILSNDPSWITDVLAIGKGSDAVLQMPSCGVPDTLTVPGNGEALRRDAGRAASVCAHGFFLVNGGPVDVNVLTIARHSAGMRLFLPGLRVGLSAYDKKVTLKGAINVTPTKDAPDSDVTRVWLYQDGTKAGPVSFIIYDSHGNEINREYPVQFDAKGKAIPATTPYGITSFAIQTPLPAAGSVVVTLGLRTTNGGSPGFNDPSSIPDGTVYVFVTVGPETGKSAPLVVVPEKVE